MDLKESKGVFMRVWREECVIPQFYRERSTNLGFSQRRRACEELCECIAPKHDFTCSSNSLDFFYYNDFTPSFYCQIENMKGDILQGHQLFAFLFYPSYTRLWHLSIMKITQKQTNPRKVSEGGFLHDLHLLHGLKTLTYFINFFYT